MMYLVKKPISAENSPCGWYGYLGIFIKTADYSKIPEQGKINIVVSDKFIDGDWWVYDYEHYFYNYIGNGYVIQIPGSLDYREGNELSEKDLEKVKYYEKILGDTILVGDGDHCI